MVRLYRILGALAVFASITAPVIGLAKPQDYAFVEGVGGIKLKAPQRSDKGWTLPVIANVAGLKTVTTAPTLMNSGLVCEKTSARISGQAIWLRIHTGTARAGRSADCPAADLGDIQAGDYVVYYEAASANSFAKVSNAAPVELGRVNIAPTNNSLYGY